MQLERFLSIREQCCARCRGRIRDGEFYTIYRKNFIYCMQCGVVKAEELIETGQTFLEQLKRDEEIERPRKNKFEMMQ